VTDRDPLREQIAEILVRHDPLRIAEEPGSDLEDAYLIEADEIAELVAGSELGVEECASVVWTVLAGNAGADEAGPVSRYVAIGADVSAVTAGSAPLPRADDLDDDFDEVGGELPSDPVVLAVLAILDDRDPACVESDSSMDESLVDDQLRYVAAAEDIARALPESAADPIVCTSLARDVLEHEFGTLHRSRLQTVGADLAELVSLQEHVRTELDQIELDSLPGLMPPPADPFCAGVLQLLLREDPLDQGDSPGAYVAEAEEIAELIRGIEPDSVHCAAITWTVVRRWSSAADTGPIAAYSGLGARMAHLVELYRELEAGNPELIAPSRSSVAELLRAEPLASRVHSALIDHDPFDLIGAGEVDATDYVPYARELAFRLRDGSPSPGWCQVLAWKVLTEPWGGLGGSLGRFRELGYDLHAVAGGR
jgi:hypothetical protein